MRAQLESPNCAHAARSKEPAQRPPNQQHNCYLPDLIIASLSIAPPEPPPGPSAAGAGANKLGHHSPTRGQVRADFIVGVSNSCERNFIAGPQIEVRRRGTLNFVHCSPPVPALAAHRAHISRLTANPSASGRGGHSALAAAPHVRRPRRVR